MATPTDDPTMETCGDVSESDPTMETIGVLSDVPMVSRNHHIGVASANFRVPGPPRIPIRIKRGPWGGNGGTHKEMEGKSQRLESLTIYHHGVVEGFQFSYIDEDGQIRTTGPWGQNRNLFIHQIMFGPSEYVKEISGHGHKANTSYLCQLKIVTNYAEYGPFGDWTGIPFRFTVPENETVVGFFGSYDTSFVTKIGAYIISKNFC